jgi:hypothetical protein
MTDSWRYKAEQLRQVPLEAILLLFGAKPDRYDKNKWHTSEGVITITGIKFINWNQDKGGGGAIDLIMHLRKLNFKDSLQWLDTHFPDYHSLSSLAAEKGKNKEIILPPKSPANLKAIKQYLIHKRGLPLNLIDTLIRSRRLYSDIKSNAVFVLLGKGKIPVGAELCGSLNFSWKGMTPGSQKDKGCFYVGASTYGKGVILCESAIDACSCFVLYPDYCCISTSGVRASPLWLQSLIKKHNTIYCGFDDDSAGEINATSMIAKYPMVKRLRPTLKDWNDTLRAR